jgi:hypothetical protein
MFINNLRLIFFIKTFFIIESYKQYSKNSTILFKMIAVGLIGICKLNNTQTNPL